MKVRYFLVALLLSSFVPIPFSNLSAQADTWNQQCHDYFVDAFEKDPDTSEAAKKVREKGSEYAQAICNCLEKIGTGQMSAQDLKEHAPKSVDNCINTAAQDVFGNQ